MVPAASGTPQYSGNFIPEVWAPMLNVKYYASSVFPGIANTKFEGQIKDVGDVVNIRTRADIVINDYEKGQPLSVQYPDSPMITFPIRKAKYFNFICDDIDKHQADINLMDEWSADAGEQMKVKIDAQGLGDIYADAHADNAGTAAGKDSESYNLGASTAPISITKVNVLDYMMMMPACLDEQNAPESGRWHVIPTWMHYLLKISDLKDVSMTGDSKSTVRHGRIGRLDTSEVHKSNQVKWVTDTVKCYYPMCGQMDAITFAAQMNKMESLQAPETFGRLVRGLNVYDYKTVKSEALVTGYITKG